MENKVVDRTVLSVKNLSKYYPGVKALDDVSIKFYEGEVHALLGENGAGKSTLIKCISGAEDPTGGIIVVKNQSYDRMTPQIAKQHGLEVIYQEFNLIPTMSVQENIYLGGRPSENRFVDYKAMYRGTKELFAKFNIKINPEIIVDTLSPAYQQIVEIAKSISKNVKILIMDEPTAPLTETEVDLLFDIVEQLKKEGVTIIYISHRIEEIFRITDRISIMRDGKYIATLNTADTNRKELIELMVGHKISETFPERNNRSGEKILEVKDLTGNGVKNVSFDLYKGEILGFAGLVGCGRTEILRVLYGAEKKESGTVKLYGREVDIRSPENAMENGLGLVPEDRKNQGVFLEGSVKWNVTLTCLKEISGKFGIVNRKQENSLVEDYKNKLQIKTPSLEQKVKNLSGGNQQKVAIAKTLSANADIIIFDEPTRGIDVGAKQEIYKLMAELVGSGKSIIMISSEMDELLGMSDRIIVLCEGKMAGILNREEFNKKHILDMASGSR